MIKSHLKDGKTNEETSLLSKMGVLCEQADKRKDLGIKKKTMQPQTIKPCAASVIKLLLLFKFFKHKRFLDRIYIN